MKIIYNLEGLDDAAIEQYKRDVSAHFGLDPDMNWFDILWMTDPDTGLRRRQLYARRGTTDVLRDKRKISVTGMEQHDGPGYVSFTAKGVERTTGREEIAVGAHSTEGFKGEKLAAAVSTAETRAGRRLTLKFCGLGILDYSEVSDPVDVKASPNELHAVAPAPIFAPQMSIPTPNAAPGKMFSPEERVALDSASQAKAEAEEIGRKALQFAQQANKSTQTITLGGPVAPVDPDFCPHCNGIKESPLTPRNQASGLCMDSFHGPHIRSEMAANAPAAPVEPKKRKPRTPRNTAVVGEATVPPQVNSAVPTQANPDATFVSPVITVPALPAPPVVAPAPSGRLESATLIPPVPPTPAPPTVFPGQPSKEQEAQYREKLREYSNVILPSAGMVPSPSIGGPSAKLRLYAERMAGKSTQQMTTDDWDDFFDGMQRFRTTNGDKGLVKYINDVIGAK